MLSIRQTRNILEGILSQLSIYRKKNKLRDQCMDHFVSKEIDCNQLVHKVYFLS